MPHEDKKENVEITWEDMRRVGSAITSTLQNIVEYMNKIDIDKILQNISSVMAQIGVVATLIKEEYNARKKLSEYQFISFGEISRELVEDILSADHPDAIMYEELKKDNFTTVANTIELIKKSNQLTYNKKLFSQSISAYKRKHYNLAIVGLLGIVDGLLTDISSLDPKTTSIFKHVESILDKITLNDVITDGEILTLYLVEAFSEMSQSLSTNKYPFNGEEPEMLNRHWIMHGRRTKEITQLDCIKIINFIYCAILFATFSKEEVETNYEQMGREKA